VEKTKVVSNRENMPISMQMKHQLGANWQEPLENWRFTVKRYYDTVSNTTIRLNSEGR
jgi:hypothetical protein